LGRRGGQISQRWEEKREEEEGKREEKKILGSLAAYSWRSNSLRVQVFRYKRGELQTPRGAKCQQQSKGKKRRRGG
jgi:hypothetical protein